MKIKKFVAPSMSECLLKVKKELGEDAVILDSRKIPRGGPFSFLLTDLIEVVASTDGEAAYSRRGIVSRRADGTGVRYAPSSSARSPSDKQTRDWTATPPQADSEAFGDGHLPRDRSRSPSNSNGSVSLLGGGSPGPVRSSKSQRIPSGDAPVIADKGESGLSAKLWPGASDRMPTGAEFALLTDDIRGLKEGLAQIADHLRFRQLPSLPVELEILHRNLLDNGVEDRVAGSITQELTLQLSGGDFEDRQLLQSAFYERIGKILKVAPLMALGAAGGGAGVPGRGQGARVIALVGPTGVGKTTTLAKMATHGQIFGRRRVALVSADTYRIAAVEQLKTFAAIANIPMEAVYRPADIRPVIERFGHYDVVLIDTAGRSPNDRGQMNDLLAFMEYARPDEVHLVLSMGTRLEDQLDVIRKFEGVRAARLVFTKLDETTSYGGILNVCFEMGQSISGGSAPGMPMRPVSALTCGQNVPDDIICPTQMQLTRLVSERGFYLSGLACLATEGPFGKGGNSI